jgi:hypothetical protein
MTIYVIARAKVEVARVGVPAIPGVAGGLAFKVVYVAYIADTTRRATEILRTTNALDKSS